jgi:hypothetical protein
MQPDIQSRFMRQWEKYFPGAGLPVCFYYTDHEEQATEMQPYSGELSLAVPWSKFIRTLENMDESFLITHAWNELRARFSTIPA